MICEHLGILKTDWSDRGSRSIHVCLVAILAGLMLNGNLCHAQTSFFQTTTSLKTGVVLERELRRGLVATWRNVSLREISRRVSDERKVAIILDRRLDPTAPRVMDVNATSLRAGLQQIAKAVHADVKLVGNTAVLGRDSEIGMLRTLVEIRMTELTGDVRQGNGAVSFERRNQLSTRLTIRWPELTSPSEIIQKIAKRYKLRIENVDAIPHDLWAANELPEMNAVELLGILLVQFDLAWEWNADASLIRIVKLPHNFSIERRYPTGRQTANAIVEKCRAKHGHISARVEGNMIVVQGRVEDHDLVLALLNPQQNGNRGNNPAANQPDLSSQEFTLRIQQVPASALLRRLEQTGIEFRYDAQSLQTAGINLNQPISLDVRKSRSREFFRAIFDQLGLDFRIEGHVVKMTPKTAS